NGGKAWQNARTPAVDAAVPRLSNCLVHHMQNNRFISKNTNLIKGILVVVMVLCK
ncbi:MAG: hypothetical protein ACI8S3_002038, partial [Alphaproteobacteria bacterium]